jgi:Putative methyltransferase
MTLRWLFVATEEPTNERSHWVRWHDAYGDPDSALSQRLRVVQAAVRRGLDEAPAGPLRLISMCAGQGRDVIDVVAEHPRRPDVDALLVELDPELVAFARRHAAEAGLADSVRVVEGDASISGVYAAAVPAQVVLVCGVFGNISPADIAATVHALPGFCTPGASVIWTRHRLAPDATPTIRQLFSDAGFDEVSFTPLPDPLVQSIGHHRLRVQPPRPDDVAAFDPARVLFTFVGHGGGGLR